MRKARIGKEDEESWFLILRNLVEHVLLGSVDENM